MSLFSSPKETSYPLRSLAWYSILIASLMAYFVVVRACNYENGTILSYLAYLALYVALPGGTLLLLALRRPIGWAMLLALGLPLGYAIEILSFLGLSWLHARDLYAWLPLAWMLPWFFEGPRRLLSPHRLLPRLGSNPVVGVTLALLFLGTILTAAGHMFAESPLVHGGLPVENPFHDWIYLVSRAASIKNLWPLEDPSLAGASLQYHYFMMVHSAACSLVTGVEVSVLVLRLTILPCGIILAAQLYLLGRLATRSRWGGHLAIVFALMASEVSNAHYAVDSAFLGRFIRWLYQSPTFFFGAIFFGAFLLLLPALRRLERISWLQALVVALLAAAATGAKGTVIPVMLGALGLCYAHECLRQRRLSLRLPLLATLLLLPFLAVYFLAMSEWGTGATTFSPLKTLELSSFWRAHHQAWGDALASFLGNRAGHLLGTGLCALVVAAGSEGLRCLALPWFLGKGLLRRHPLVLWLGLVWSVCVGLGLLFDMDCYSQLYFLLLGQIPAAVLTAAATLWLVARGRRFLRGLAEQLQSAKGRSIPCLLQAGGFICLIFVLSATLTTQIRLWAVGIAPGLHRFHHEQAHVSTETYQLHEAMRWLRAHTEKDAILVTNTFTSENLSRGRQPSADATWLGTHYFYSALSERRVYVEGPAYLLNQGLARARMAEASRIFYGGASPISVLPRQGHRYVILDHALRDQASVNLPRRDLVFSNPRIDIYRVPSFYEGSGLAAISLDRGHR